MSERKETFLEFWNRQWAERCPPGTRLTLFAAGAVCALVLIAWVRSAAVPKRWDGKL